MDISVEFYEDSSQSFSDSNSGRRRDNESATESVPIKTGEYNLRPRRCKRAFDPSDCLDNANSPTENADPKSDPFAAIPSAKRRKKSTGRAARNSKSKAPPLSKYRRKTANARERNRMQEINQAFERLRNAVPQLPPSHLALTDPTSPEASRDGVKGSSRKGKVDKKKEEDDENCKMTKITTLRLAVNYIAALSQILSQSQRENGKTSTECRLSDAENSRDDNKGKKGEKVATEPVSSSTCPPNFADFFAVQGHKARLSSDKESRDKEAFLGSDQDPITTTTISDEDLREFEEEYCPGGLSREPLTDDDLALIPDEAFVREFFSLHADAPGQQDDVFRLVATHQHDVVDFV